MRAGAGNAATWLAALGLATSGCGDSTRSPADVVPDAADTAANDVMAPPNPEVDLPPGFLWGAALAGFQSDMGCPTLSAEICEDRASDWYQWVSDPDLVAAPTTFVTGEPVSNGPGFRELYPEDLQRLAGELNGNAIRVSIEWSRLFPDEAALAATTVAELEPLAVASEVAFYRDLFAKARAAGLRPIVTLNHYTLPLWIHDGAGCHADITTCTRRGWVDREPIRTAIGLYAGFCGKAFGDLVDDWATLNEPLANVLAGYLQPSSERSHPPGVQFRIQEALAVLFNQIHGHAAMVDGLRANDMADADNDGEATFIGTVVNLAAFFPADPEAEGAADAARHASWLHNELFLEGVARGAVDTNIDGITDPPDPALAGRLDWIGVNYYTRLGVTPLGFPLIESYPWVDFLPVTDEGLFQTYPEGLHAMLQLASRFELPIIVTENGMLEPTPDGGETFLKPHLRAIQRALDDGIDVRGYLYWTLVDNYEWNHGLSLPFGLYALDPATKTRTLRPIGAAFGAIGRDRGF
jgi:beta-galactosidase